MDDLNFGIKLRERRLEKGLSLRRAAGLADITPSMLSQIENGQANPSLSTLRAVCAVLELALYDLFKTDEKDKKEEPVVLYSERRIIEDKNEPQVRYELLTRDNRGSLEFCQMVVKPKNSSYSVPQSHIGEEVALVLGGCAQLDLNGAVYTLKAGDSLRIAPNTPHIWKNIGDSELVVVFAVTPPTF